MTSFDLCITFLMYTMGDAFRKKDRETYRAELWGQAIQANSQRISKNFVGKARGRRANLLPFLFCSTNFSLSPRIPLNFSSLFAWERTVARKNLVASVVT